MLIRGWKKAQGEALGVRREKSALLSGLTNGWQKAYLGKRVETT